MPPSQITFGPFRYDSEQRLLFRDQQPVPLGIKLLDTLHVLLEQRGQVVDKQELMRRIWPDTVVEESGLARNISMLRRALGDEAEEARYIETIPRRGYRFVAEPVETPSSEQPASKVRTRPHWWRWAIFIPALAAVGVGIYWQFYRPSRFLPSGEGCVNVALIPFEGQDSEPLTSPLEDLLVADLARLQRVRVLSPSTVHHYRSLRILPAIMGRVLGLQVLLEGHVSRSRDRIRIAVRMADVHNAHLVWAETYDFPVGDAETRLPETSHAIAAQVGAHLETDRGR